MPTYDAFQEHEAIHRSKVMSDTWGHLYPEVGIKYKCRITVAKGVCGDSIIFDYNFERLNDSPWLFQDFTEFALSSTNDFKAPGLFRFEGWYKKFKNGNCQFGGGKFVKVEVNQ